MINNPLLDIEDKKRVDVYLAQIGDEARKSGLKLLVGLWDEDVTVEGSLDKGGISEQLSIANKLNARYALIVGQKEAYNETVILKEMASGSQEVFPQDKVIKEIKKRTNKNSL
jgi:histidyl-tRNA synthetase